MYMYIFVYRNTESDTNKFNTHHIDHCDINNFIKDFTTNLQASRTYSDISYGQSQSTFLVIY